MRSDSAPSPQLESIPIRNGILTLCGYGLTVSVEHGRLAIADGLGDRRRASHFSKATCGIERLVILGHSGTLSLEAVRWLHDIHAAVVQIDADGNLLFASYSTQGEIWSASPRASVSILFATRRRDRQTTCSRRN